MSTTTSVLVDERQLRLLLERDGPRLAGESWAEMTAEVIRQTWRARLPTSFPALLVDAERVAANAGLGARAARAMYRRANAAWRRLARADGEPARTRACATPTGVVNRGCSAAGCAEVGQPTGDEFES